MTPLHVVGDETDDFAKSVASVLTVPVALLDEDSESATRRELRRRARMLRSQAIKPSLDLVGHSASGLMTICKWAIDDSDVFNSTEVAELVSGFSCIRLLGCTTAGIGDPADTLVSLNSWLGIPILGTTRAIHPANDFRPEGFKREKFSIVAPPLPPDQDETLLAHDEVQQPAVINELRSRGFQKRWFERFPRVPFDPLHPPMPLPGHAQALPPLTSVPFLQRDARLIPGFAWRPDFGTFVSSGAQRVRVSFVAGGTMARMKTAGGGLYWNLSDDEMAWGVAHRMAL